MNFATIQERQSCCLGKGGRKTTLRGDFSNPDETKIIIGVNTLNIIVCYKNVPEEQDIQVNPDKTLDLGRAAYKTGQYDLNAVEAGMQIAEAVAGSTVNVLTVGGDTVDNAKLKKGILSRGPAQMYAVKDASLSEADSFMTAAVLKAAIERLGGADLVLCGEGSGDMYNQQVGNTLGALMDLATVNAVSKITPQGNSLIVERSVEDGVEVLEVALPAVISVSSDINIPRIPGMKDILGAGKKPSTVWNLSEVTEPLQNPSRTISILAPEQTDRRQMIVEGDGDDAIEAFYSNIRRIL